MNFILRLFISFVFRNEPLVLITAAMMVSEILNGWVKAVIFGLSIFSFMGYYQNQNLEPLTCEFEGVFYIEEWKPIIGYELRYEVSTFSRIRSIRNERFHYSGVIKKLRLNRRGYPITRFGQTGKGAKNLSVHTLCSKVFVPNPDNKPFVNHKDGINTNSFYKNFEWVTAKENSEHAVKNGLTKAPKGVDNGQSILTEEQVLGIFNASGTHREVGLLYNIHQRNVSFIKNGWAWSHLTGKKYERKRLTIDDVLKIKTDYRNGVSLNELCVKYKRTYDHMIELVSGKRWKSLSQSQVIQK